MRALEQLLNGSDASHQWPDISYNNSNLFDNYIRFLDFLESNAETVKESSWTNTEIDEDGDEYEEQYTTELQETYLGYITESDTFISGFDMWEGDENPAGEVHWKMKEDGEFEIVLERIDDSSIMVYGKQGSLNKWKSKYPTLVDIRLD